MLRRLAVFLLIPGTMVSVAAAQVLHFPAQGDAMSMSMSIDAIQSAQMDFNILTINGQGPNSPLVQSASASVSKLDLKAPGKAKREYDKGYQLLLRKDYPGAIEHLGSAIQIYPSYVAAHNALGSAYLAQDKNEEARLEFDKAVALDDHLPNSYLNLGCAALALKQYPAAEDALQKASSIAPLDLQLHTALAYGQFLNHDYPAVIETAHQVHQHKHKNAALVHYFAAGAWAAQNNLTEAQQEMETLLREDPKSETADQFRKILADMKTEQVAETEAKLHPAKPVAFTFAASTPGISSEDALHQAQQVIQDVKLKNQIAEAEAAAAAADASCAGCVTVASKESADLATSGSGLSSSGLKKSARNSTGLTFHAGSDEVALLFAATDHGKSVTNLTESDIVLSDDNRPPHTILGFKNESELPLRLGLIIDTSNSVTQRLSFEQGAATKFMQAVVTNKDDLAFVVGVNNSVLLVQDFSGDQALIGHAINQLAPGGGTALWDAVSFGAEKLGERAEDHPVARVLVVISDGDDNASSVSLKEAIASALRGEVAVYTVSTRDLSEDDPRGLVGSRALNTLSELTGGTTFIPGSVPRLKGSLSELQQVIRARYLVSYKPESFQRDGRYRAIEIKAEKDGRKLKVYARKGYYASAGQPASEEQ
jgi:Ca-activated chloride channel family protein